MSLSFSGKNRLHTRNKVRVIGLQLAPLFGNLVNSLKDDNATVSFSVLKMVACLWTLKILSEKPLCLIAILLIAVLPLILQSVKNLLVRELVTFAIGKLLPERGVGT